MKFYSKITNKPNAVIEEIKDGLKIVKQTRLCMFKNGVLETEDKKIIEKLKEHPEQFRTDKPYPVVTEWKDTKEGKEMIKKGEKLGIKVKNVRKEYLEKLIKAKEQKLGIKNKVKAKVLGKILKGSDK